MLLRGRRSRSGLTCSTNPIRVQETLGELLAADKWIHERVFEYVHALEEGSPRFASAPGTNIALCCDFSCNISPQLYRSSSCPRMEDLTNWAD